MKMTGRVIWLIFFCFSQSSCISEEYLECPDYGKYRVIFTTKDSLKMPEKMYMSLIYREQNNGLNLYGREQYIKPANKADFTSDKTLKLLPGNYRFYSLSGSEPLIFENGLCRMKNRVLYLYGDTLGRVVKSYGNRIELKYYPVNSLILAQCILDKELAIEYEIKDFAISAPDDSSVVINPENGSATSSGTITEFFDYFELSKDVNLFWYCCVPFRGGCYINFRITLVSKNLNLNEGEEKIRVLRNRLFLNSDIEQGRVYKFTFDVSALEISCKSTTVSDWDEYESDGEIPVI